MTRENPFVGPKPFETADEERFFGRNTESNQLVAMITADPVVLLYADSGAGKTSLLRAKVIPTLRRNAFEVIGPLRVGGVPVNQQGNPYTNNALLSLAKSTAATSLTEYLGNLPSPSPKERPKDAKRVALRPPRVLMIDQFEELFTSTAEWWPYREPFFADLGHALDEDPRLRIVIGMREEYIACLDPYAPLIPGALRRRYRLQRLGEDSAIAAIEGPIARTDVTISRDTTRALVQKLRTQRDLDTLSEFVEPLHLQVVCGRIWESLKGASEINTEMVHATGSVDDALMSYYETSVRSVAAETNEPEGAIRSWFERELITDGSTRGIVFCGASKAGSLKYDSVKKLEDKYLVRAEYRGGARWYELSHDRMIQPVLESGLRWRELPSSALINRLEVTADQWIKRGQPKGELLDAAELDSLDRWQRTKVARNYVWTSQLKDLVQASKLAEQQSATRRMRIQLMIVAVALLISSVFAYYAYRQKQKADSATWRSEFKVASTFIEPKKYFYALAWSTDAYWKARKQQHTLTTNELGVFREASTAIGDDLWLRAPSGSENVGFSRNGRFALTSGKGQACFWDIQRPDTWRHSCLTLSNGTHEGTRANTFDDDSFGEANFVTDDGSVGVLVTGRGFRVQSSAEMRIRIVTPKHEIASADNLIAFAIASDRHFVAYATPASIEVLRLRTGKKITIPRIHQRLVQPTFGSGITLAISPAGGWLAVVEHLPNKVQLTSYDLAKTPPIPRVIFEAKKGDYTWLDFIDNGKCLRYVLFDGDETVQKDYAVGAWQLMTLPKGTVIASSTNPSITVRLTQKSEGVRSQRFIGQEVGGTAAKPLIVLEGEYADNKNNTLLLGDRSSTRWTVWRPLEQWFPAQWFSRPKEFGKVRLADPNRFYVQADDAVRVFPFPKESQRPDLKPDELFARGCRQLRWQPEWEIVKDICPK